MIRSGIFARISWHNLFCSTLPVGKLVVQKSDISTDRSNGFLYVFGFLGAKWLSGLGCIVVVVLVVVGFLVVVDRVVRGG